jgi:D-inositol-3-phosphate glycosyltransferase
MHTDPLETLGGEVTGGMNVYVRELARLLPQKGIHVDVFTRASDSGFPPIEEIIPGARLVRIPAGPIKPLDKFSQSLFTQEFASEIQSFAESQSRWYDLLSTHYWLSAIAGRFLSKEWKIPLAHRFHTIAFQKNQALQTKKGHEPEDRVRAETKIAKHADVLFASSNAEGDIMAKDLGASRPRVHILPCGVDLEQFQPVPRGDARASLGLKENDRVLLSVGRIEPVKGLDRLVHILASMKSKRPNLPLQVIHVGGAVHNRAQSSSGGELQPKDFASLSQREEVQRILKLAEESGLAGRFRFMGAQQQEELPKFYSAADVLAICSRYESFGMVSLEAAACGLPAVAFDVGGLSSAIENGFSGLLVPDGNLDDFANQVLDLLTRVGVRERLGSGARNRVQSFSWSAIASKEIQVWEKMLREYKVSRKKFQIQHDPERDSIMEKIL